MMEDRHLPSLTRAIDPVSMSAGFEEFFRREYPDRGLRVTRCEVCQVHHKPGRSCRVIYRLRGRDEQDRSFDQWVHAKIRASGHKQSRRRHPVPDSWIGCGFWKPIREWPEMGMVVYSFPYDRRLSHLAPLLEPGLVSRTVERHASRFGVPPGSTCREVLCHKIKYRPGKSCTLRFEVVVGEPGGGERKLEFYSKTYEAGPRSRYVHEVLEQLYRQTNAVEGGLVIPRPLLHVPSACSVWQESWPGRRLTAIADQLGWERFLESSHVTRVADALATLQRIEVVDPKHGPGRVVVIEQVRRDASDIEAYLADERLADILERLLAAQPASEASLPRSTIHGTFKLSQILSDGDRVALVDFDSAAVGDPLYDVGEFVASLVYRRVTQPVSRRSMQAAVERFLDRYDERVDWPCDRGRVAWYAGAFLLGKLHASLKTLSLNDKPAVNDPLKVIAEWLDDSRMAMER